MNTPAKLIACAASFITPHAVASARQFIGTKTRFHAFSFFENGPGSRPFAAHAKHGGVEH